MLLLELQSVLKPLCVGKQKFSTCMFIYINEYSFVTVLLKFDQFLTNKCCQHLFYVYTLFIY